MNSDNHKRRIEQAEYRAKLVEAELNAIKQSRSYKLSTKIGIIKNQLVSDPVGLTKKAARILVNEPKKFRHMIRSVNRSAFIAQSVVEQNTKYQEWILLNEPDEQELDKQRKAAEKLSKQPLISIVTPVFNPPVDVLEELIESVLDQTYSNFELCLGNFGDDEAVDALLREYERTDPRIKLFTFKDNRGIAGNSNQILEKVSGEFIALLDHDDTLSPDALYENAKLLNEKPYDFIYSDKDKIDEQGNRFDPLFKPGLSPEMLLNINYLTHLNVMRTSIVRDIGGWDPKTDGAQDWDLFLRVVEASKHIGFIPKVLYHWRVIASSTAHSIDAKPYALAGQRRAVDKYLAKQKIPATSYHRKTELLLRWDNAAIDNRPIAFINYSSSANTHRIIRHLRRSVRNPEFIILAGESTEADQKLSRQFGDSVITYGPSDFGGTFKKIINNVKDKERTVLFIDDSIRPPKGKDWYASLIGWLSIDGVSGVSGRLLDRQDTIVDSGAFITKDCKYFPIFQGYPKYYQSYIGNAEWVRNLSVLSPSFCATKLSLLKTFDFKKEDREEALESYFLWASQRERLVMTPHVTAITYGQGAPTKHVVRSLEKKYKDGYNDQFSNPNLSAQDPMRLFADEPLPGLSIEHTNKQPLDPYQHDAIILADTFDINLRELGENKKVTQTNKPLRKFESVAWFLASFDAVYAGLMNIFSFANYLANEEGLKTTIYILKSTKDVTSEAELARKAFPGLKNAKFMAITPSEVSKVKNHDIGIATLWSTAFVLAKVTSIQRKCYFIQDHEANFYPKGTISALVEQSYKFGFLGIANTQGLLDLYQKQYGGKGVVLKSLVDLSAYHPRKELFYNPQRPYKVFFYARPNMPRNAFELGIAGLKLLKKELGASVEIITAGAAWDPAQYGVEGLFTNLGKLTYEAVPKLYRSVDAGLMFMFSGHPGVTASELMASGCPVVVNQYDDVTWHELYQHEKTCLTTLPTASEVARNLKRCLTENDLRKTLIKNGLEVTKHFYDGYETSQKAAANVIKNGQ